MDGLFIRICIIKCYQIFSHIYHHHHHRHHHCHCNPELSSAVGRFLIFCMYVWTSFNFILHTFAFSVNSRGIKGLSLGLLVFFSTSSSMAVAIHEVVDLVQQLDCHFSLPGTGTGSRAKPSVYPYMSLLASIAIIDMSSGSLELYTGSRFSICLICLEFSSYPLRLAALGFKCSLEEFNVAFIYI